MRAMIFGAAGTTYLYALFFFDIKFPSNYPDSPPKVHYWSHGLSPNPFLLASGHICLSLLHPLRWISYGNLRWLPSKSTILQVLVSIPALVLTDKLNIDHHSNWHREYELFCDEDAFVKTCKSTVYLLRNPPKNFEAFVAGYFRSKANDVLRAYIGYVHGRLVPIWHYPDYSNLACLTAENNSRHFVSEKSKEQMELLYPIFVQAFKSTGYSPEDWVEEEVLILERKRRVTRVPFSWGKLCAACLPCFTIAG